MPLQPGRGGREWKSWMKIAAALELGANDTMAELRINRREGRTYTTAFSKWCRSAGFTNPEIDSKTRSYLLYLMEPEHRIVCKELRGAMTAQERMRISHPQTMYKRVRDYLHK